MDVIGSAGTVNKTRNEKGQGRIAARRARYGMPGGVEKHHTSALRSDRRDEPALIKQAPPCAEKELKLTGDEKERRELRSRKEIERTEGELERMPAWDCPKARTGRREKKMGAGKTTHPSQKTAPSERLIRAAIGEQKTPRRNAGSPGGREPVPKERPQPKRAPVALRKGT